MPDLLIELFSEEIPARMQARAAEDLRRLVTDGLVEAGLTYAHAAAFATPRRLALAVEGLAKESPTTREERKGPRTDAPEKALAGFLRSTGLTRDQLQARDDKKGQVWFAVIERPGRPAAEIVAEVLERAIRGFPWPKSMRWGAASATDGALRWVRPLHSILCLLSDEGGATVVPLEVTGIRAGDTTEGHRFMAPGRFSVKSFDDYEARLRAAHVVLRAEARADAIAHDAAQQAFARGLEVVEDKALLAEVAGLVEWPLVLVGEIDAAFLDLPPEVLQTSMRAHQKFFSLRDPASGRIGHFATVANIAAPDDGAMILAGNRKVLAARLADAAFFWENDLRKVDRGGMEALAEGLAQVTFHAKLGSQAARVARIAALAREIAPAAGADPDLAETAARVCKADLMSEMVYEFPELQGIMGRYYSKRASLPDPVAQACELHYKPLGPSDEVPSDLVSATVALADKLDTLTGFWAIDEKPTGSKDPYALRRAAQGVIRLVLENALRMALEDNLSASFFEHLDQRLTSEESALWRELRSRKEDYASVVEFASDVVGEEKSNALVQAVKEMQADSDDGLIGDKRIEKVVKTYVGKQANFESYVIKGRFIPSLLSFLHDRLKVHLKDEGIRHDVIDAVLAMPNSDDLTLVVARARALNAFLATDDGANLLQGFRRANNILAQAEERDGVEYSFGADRKLAEGPEEKALFDALDAADARVAPAMQAEDFGAAMTQMAALRAPIDAFFEAVQINTDNEILRRNRLNLLHRIRATCLSVSDLNRIEGAPSSG